MGVYSVRGFTTATASAADETVCALWNPHATRRIQVLEFGVYRTGITGLIPTIDGITARGTAGSTVTPDADNGWDTDDTPPSGVLLDLAAYSVAPTFAAPRLFGARLGGGTGSGGSGYVWVFASGLALPPSRGLALRSRAVEVWTASEVYYVWEEN